jgi:hypothetical protein
MVVRGSVPALGTPEEGPPLVTELVVGERLEVAGSRPGWLEVFVPSHTSRLDPHGYPDWVRYDAMIEMGNLVPGPEGGDGKSGRARALGVAAGEGHTSPMGVWSGC